MEGAFGGFSLIVVMFLFILAILWFVLPFAIFGTKAILRDTLREQKKQTKLLKRLVAQSSGQTGVSVSNSDSRVEPRI